LAFCRNVKSWFNVPEFDGIERPQYFYCVYNGALLAKRLGHEHISVIEFGVANGNGLLILENYAEAVSKIFNIKIDVYGFDTGKGLPSLDGFRDMPYWWQPGFFEMDIEGLKKKLRFAKLVIGDIRESASHFFDKYNPAPIAAVMHDMDLYSSTNAALKIFNADTKYFLPRIFNYFDDIIGNDIMLCSDFTGERFAIDEFNAVHDNRKLSPAYHLITKKKIERWYHQIFILHLFNHEEYGSFIREEEDGGMRMHLYPKAAENL
jgi:hypothetical protein